MSSILVFVIFSIIFGILVDRFEFINHEILQIVYTTTKTVNKPTQKSQIKSIEDLVNNCLVGCKGNEEGDWEEDWEGWIKKHIMESWELFWSCSLMCFLLGAYSIGGSIYVYNNEEDEKPLSVLKKENSNNENEENGEKNEEKSGEK